MKQFDIITIFPNVFDCYFSESIIKRAREDGHIKIDIHDLREFTTYKHRTVDDTPYGGGPGMVMKVEPIYRAVSSIISNFQFPISNKIPNLELQKSTTTRVILFSAKGKTFNQEDARRLLKYDRLIMICGRYEGVDERVAEKIADEEISIGDYVLTGGEIPAMAVVDSVTRLIPGVLGNPESLNEESFGGVNDPIHRSADKIQNRVLEYPQYSRPEDFNGWKVPEVLLGGNHKEIDQWRKQKSRRSE